MPGTFGRYEEIPVNKMSAAQKEAYNCLANGPRGRLPGPYKVWVHNPKLVHAADPLGRHFTPGSYSLTEREREITVLVINSRWRSDYPIAAHERRGKEVGLPRDAVEAIIAGQPDSFTDPHEQVVYEVAIALANERIVPEGLRVGKVQESAGDLTRGEAFWDMLASAADDPRKTFPGRHSAAGIPGVTTRSVITKICGTLVHRATIAIGSLRAEFARLGLRTL